MRVYDLLQRKVTEYFLDFMTCLRRERHTKVRKCPSCFCGLLECQGALFWSSCVLNPIIIYIFCHMEETSCSRKKKAREERVSTYYSISHSSSLFLFWDKVYLCHQAGLELMRSSDHLASAFWVGGNIVMHDSLLV